MRRVFAAFLLLAFAACTSGPPAPAELDTRTEACASCRMGVSDRKLAAQLVAPSEEPLFFDEVGCLRDYLKAHPRPPRGALAYVADHRTGEWIPAARAVYTRVPTLSTPMDSHLVAHANPASRAADPLARDGEALTARDVFGAPGPP